MTPLTTKREGNTSTRLKSPSWYVECIFIPRDLVPVSVLRSKVIILAPKGKDLKFQRGKFLFVGCKTFLREIDKFSLGKSADCYKH